MANGSSTTSGASGQEFCLKWCEELLLIFIYYNTDVLSSKSIFSSRNNHRTTIISVMDTLLEEESLVDVTLSADGQFLR